jgi:hypothetical protein
MERKICTNRFSKEKKMARINQKIIISVCILACALFIAGPLTRPKVEAQTRIPQLNQSDPYRNSIILVEAFVVWVKLSALDDLGVSPIGEKPNSITIDNIQTCLEDGNSAKVGSGVKVATHNRGKGHVELEETIYMAQETIKINHEGKSAVSKSYHPYQVGKYFEATASGISNNIISIKYDFRQEEAQKTTTKDEAPPNIAKRFWDGTVYIERGKASIVGATQDEEKAYFLILCADIK